MNSLWQMTTSCFGSYELRNLTRNSPKTCCRTTGQCGLYPVGELQNGSPTWTPPTPTTRYCSVKGRCIVLWWKDFLVVNFKTRALYQRQGYAWSRDQCVRILYHLVKRCKTLGNNFWLGSGWGGLRQDNEHTRLPYSR